MANEDHPFAAAFAHRAPKPAPVNGGVVTPIRAAPVPAGDPGAVRYAQAALTKECDALAGTGEGQRNHALNKAGFNIAQLVAAGHLDAQDAQDSLVQAALSCGLAIPEIRATLGSAFDAGAKQPRVVPARDETGTATDFGPGVRVAQDGGPTLDGDEADPFRHGIDGEKFVFQVETHEKALWGSKEKVIWSPGEALIVTGAPGVGKTTTVQQLILARVGLADQFLGFDVETTASKVLYLAMDRPRQIARSMRRMVDDGDRGLLAERLMVWRGPLPYDVADRSDVLLRMAEHYGADTIVVDSVKDAALGLSDSERAGKYNRARQRALAGGIEIVEIAHQVKKGAAGAAPKALADVHGGMELTAGAGSVVLIWGEAGDPVVEFLHLKQPAELVGPLTLVHDHEAGRTTLEKRMDEADVLRSEPWKVWTVLDIAGAVSGSDKKPSRSDMERSRRKLEKLIEAGCVLRIPGAVNPNGGKPENRYRWAESAPDTTWTAS